MRSPPASRRRIRAAFTSTRIGWAAALASGIAALAVLLKSDATECYVDAVSTVRETGQTDLDPASCDGSVYDEVLTQIQSYQDAVAGGDLLPIELEPELAARVDLGVWYALLAALIVIAIAAIAPSVRTVRAIGARRRDYLGNAWWLVALALATGVATRLLDSFELGPIEGIGQEFVSVVVAVVILATLPTVAGALAIGEIVRRCDDQPSSCSWEHLRQIGRTLRWHAWVLGLILTVGVLTTAARWSAVDNLPGGANIPSAGLMIYGAIFAAAMAAIYVPVHNAWLQLVDQRTVAEVGGDRFAPGTATRLTELRQLVGAEESTAQRIEASLVLLTPLLGAAISSLFA